MTIAIRLALVLLIMSTMTADGQQGATGGEINFFENYVDVKGLGLAAKNVDPKSPQGYVTARRAAVVDANRNLAEIISQIQVDSATLVELGQVLRDAISQRVATTMRGGLVVSESSRDDFNANGVIEVTLRLPLSGSGGVLNAIMPTLRPEIVKRQAEMKLTPYTPPPATTAAAPPTAPPPTATPTAPPPAAAYDGIIIRVPAQFKPSIAPKVFTDKGEVLYSAMDVAIDILISRGTAQYTNNEGKAKTILEGMGAKTVLNVEASLRTDTDAELKSDDAAKIYSANKKTTFLNKGRVVFLVGKS